MRTSIALALLLMTATTPATSQTVYKCAVEGRTTFQDRPCAGAKSSENQIDARQRTKGLGGVRNIDLLTQSEMRLAIERGRVKNGMSPDQVKRAWGAPDKVNKSSGGREQWVYRRGNGESKYIYLEGGQVEAWN